MDGFVACDQEPVRTRSWSVQTRRDGRAGVWRLYADFGTAAARNEA